MSEIVNIKSRITQEDMELIDQYLSNQLTESASIEFEERLNSDSEWALKVQEQKITRIGIQQEAIANKLEEFHQHIRLATKAGARPFKPKKFLAAAAAILIVAGALVWMLFFNTSSEDRLYSKFYQPDEGLPTLMGVSDNYAFEAAMVDYKIGKYQKAINEWEQLLTTNAANDTLNYFIGSAYLALDNSEKAIVYFDKTLSVSQTAFLQEVQWYKVLALIKNGKKAEAIELLKHTQHPQKEQLLAKLKE